MSRWNINIENMETTISQIKDLLNSDKVLNVTDFNITEEVKRAKVVLESISSYLKAINPYLINPNVGKEIEDCLDNTKSFVSNVKHILNRDTSDKKNFANTVSEIAREDSHNDIKKVNDKLTDIFNIISTGIPFGLDYDEMQQRKQELTKYEEEQKKKIDELLGMATNASLASSFRASRESYDKSIKFWQRLFFAAIVLFLVLLIVIFTTNVFGEKLDFTSYASLPTMLSRVLICSPIIWFAIFSSRIRNEMSRLQEEYKYKETIATSYDGFKKQIDAMRDDDSEKLKAKLVDAFIDIVNQNPNSSLAKVEKEDTPIIEMFRSIYQKIVKSD